MCCRLGIPGKLEIEATVNKAIFFKQIMAPTTNKSVAYDLPIEVENLPEQVSCNLAGYQNKIARYLFEISCLSKLEAINSEHYLPSEFLKYFEKIMALYDESVQFLLGHMRRRGFTIQCQPGCCHCCYHMPTGVSAGELLYLYHGMCQTGIMERFFRRCLEAEESWVEVIRRHHISADCRAELDSSYEASLTCYQRLERACPFLQDKRCQVYAYRPLACRMHFSLSAPHWCHPAHFHNAYAVRFNLEPGAPVVDALNHLDDRLQLRLSDMMACGLLELIVNVMQFREIHWIN